MARNGMQMACAVGAARHTCPAVPHTFDFEVGRAAMTKGKAIRSAFALISSHTIPGAVAQGGGLRPRFGRLSRGEAGSTVAETALVLPVLLVVLTGIFSFGIILNQYLVLTNAVNGGARGFAASAPGSCASSSARRRTGAARSAYGNCGTAALRCSSQCASMRMRSRMSPASDSSARSGSLAAR